MHMYTIHHTHPHAPCTQTTLTTYTRTYTYAHIELTPATYLQGWLFHCGLHLVRVRYIHHLTIYASHELKLFELPAPCGQFQACLVWSVCPVLSRVHLLSFIAWTLKLDGKFWVHPQCVSAQHTPLSNFIRLITMIDSNMPVGLGQAHEECSEISFSFFHTSCHQSHAFLSYGCHICLFYPFHLILAFLPSFFLSAFKVWAVYSQDPHQSHSPPNFVVRKLCVCFINSLSHNDPMKAALLWSHFMGDHTQKDKSLALGHRVQSVLELNLNTGHLSLGFMFLTLTLYSLSYT